MAAWDSPDLLAQMNLWLRRPAADVAVSGDDLYSLLSAAEAEEKRILVVHNPGPMLDAPVKLASADGGKTYAFPADKQYIYIELYPSLTGLPLREGPFWSATHDYTLEGPLIRMVRGLARTFADGPWFRGVAPAGPINATTASTIFPEEHRILIVYSALRKWARISGQYDPETFQAEYQKSLYGDPRIPGDIGILGSIRKRDPRSGTPAGSNYAWWRPA